MTVQRPQRGPVQGIVYLVGAGPGDPDLITVKGLRLLRAADAVVYDRLVHPALLDEVSFDAERIFVGKEPGYHAVPQEAIHVVLINRARAGKVVVRLKGGDPFVFGRGGEECEGLRAAGVRFEIVPGVTSAVAVPAFAGIPVTHRRYGSAFAVLTGHECDGLSDVDWGALARIPTLVILMGLHRLRAIAGRLLALTGRPSTPVAVVARGTTADQQVVIGTLSTIADRVQEGGLDPPATIIVGEVVELADRLAWFPPAPSRPSAVSGCSRLDKHGMLLSNLIGR